MAEHLCVECKLDPPKTVRKVTSGNTARSWRCHSHTLAKKRRDKEKRRFADVARKYGLTADEYVALLEYQGYKCAFPKCNANGKSKALAVDHDHRKARQHDHPEDRACRDCVRGLVCSGHNYYVLGLYAGDLQDGLDYLAEPPFVKMLRLGLV